jgi:hypothetical protein
MRRACVAAAAAATRPARTSACTQQHAWCKLAAAQLPRRGVHGSSSSTHADDDTIFALSTAPGRAALAVVRASGPCAHAGVAALLSPGTPLPPARTAALVRLSEVRESGQRDPLDQALLLLFPAPRSATGEDVAELHLHGGPAVVAGVLAALARTPVRLRMRTILRTYIPHVPARSHNARVTRRAGAPLCLASSRVALSTRACLI